MNPLTARVNPNRLRQARLSAGKSQNELAREINSSVGNINRWENGKHTPRVEAVAAIAEATGKPMDYFFGSDDDEGDSEDDEEAALSDLVDSLHRIVKAELKRVRKGVAAGDKA